MGDDYLDMYEGRWVVVDDGAAAEYPILWGPFPTYKAAEDFGNTYLQLFRIDVVEDPEEAK